MSVQTRAALVRAGPLLLLAGVLVALLAQSSLLRLLPFAPAAFVAYGAVAIVLGLVPALVAQRSPLPAILAVAVPVIALSAYDQSRLDWLRLLRDFGVSQPGLPAWGRVALSAGALLLAWAAHALDHAARLRWSAIERGIAIEQAAAARSLALRRAAWVGAVALLGTALVASIAVALSPADAGLLFGGRASLLAPLLAVGLIAAAAVLVAGARAEGEAPAPPAKP